MSRGRGHCRTASSVGIQKPPVGLGEPCHKAPTVSKPLHQDDIFTLGSMLRLNKMESTVLHIDSVPLNSSEAAAIFDGMQSNTHLKKLHIYVGDIGNAGAASLGAMLASNKSLKHLAVTTDRTLSSRGAMAIANGLKQNWTLEFFYIQDQRSKIADVLVNRKSASNQWDAQGALM